jgi:hypothetical protein
MSLDLRPLTLGELLDRSFGLYRRHFWLFVGIMALPSLLALAFGVVVAVFSPQPQGQAAMAAGQVDPSEMIGAVIWFGAASMGMLAVYFVAYAVALGATTVAVSELYMGRPVTIKGSYLPLRGKVGRLALLMVLVSIRLFGIAFLGVVVIGGSAALGAVGSPVLAALIVLAGMFGTALLWMWMVLRYAVVIPAAVLEDETASDAIGRSIELTRGSLLRVFALLLFTMIVTYAVLAVFQGPFVFAAIAAGPEGANAFWLNLMGTIAGSIGGAFTAPLLIVAFAVLYYDLRVRQEGLDLQVMLANLNAASGATAPAPSSTLLPG